MVRSSRQVLSLPAETRLFMCHDYRPEGREARWETTVAEVRARNIHMLDRISEEQFIDMRKARDAEPDMPVLILPSVQVDLGAGKRRKPENCGMRSLNIPLNAV